MVGLTMPSETRAQDDTEVKWTRGDSIPSGHHVETRSARAHAIAGGSLFGTMYAGSATAGVLSWLNGTPEGAPMLIPIVGPFVTIGTAGSNPYFSPFLQIGLVIDGISQGIGFGLLLSGLVGHETEVLVKDDTAMRAPTLHIGARAVSLTCPF